MSERVYREHELIVEAVVAKDKVKAIKLMEAHLMGIHDRFRESFEQIAMEGRV
jgi:DNA-binding GntR family transcriptional regulator